ncbi:MAG TPA: TIGR02281 family clan AA aspartic protease [Allosphingosinicella sp.]|nr:TIGR02281 family clan AA aspartic protease [Allosphingosinicella sp.]
MSGGDRALSLIYIILLLVLVGSGLAVRRAPIGQTLKMALAWVLIFGIGFAVFALRDDFRALGSRMLAELRGEAGQETNGETLRIRLGDDGHFWVDGQVNGRAVRFLVDSGATVTTLSRTTAERVGVSGDGGFPVRVETAGGTMLHERGSADRISVGPIEREDLAVHIAPTREAEINVIGMNFLRTLSGWGVEGRTLVLRP